MLSVATLLPTHRAKPQSAKRHHLSISFAKCSNLSRSSGSGVAPHLAYRAALKLAETNDYTKRKHTVQDVFFEGWNGTHDEFAAAVEASEKRKDARLLKEIVWSLPHDATDEQRREIVQTYARSLRERYGVAVHAAIHQPRPKDFLKLPASGLNWHAHISFTTRPVDEHGKFGPKKVTVLDKEAWLDAEKNRLLALVNSVALTPASRAPIYGAAEPTMGRAFGIERKAEAKGEPVQTEAGNAHRAFVQANVPLADLAAELAAERQAAAALDAEIEAARIALVAAEAEAAARAEREVQLAIYAARVAAEAEKKAAEAEAEAEKFTYEYIIRKGQALGREGAGEIQQAATGADRSGEGKGSRGSGRGAEAAGDPRQGGREGRGGGERHESENAVTGSTDAELQVGAPGVVPVGVRRDSDAELDAAIRAANDAIRASAESSRDIGSTRRTAPAGHRRAGPVAHIMRLVGICTRRIRGFYTGGKAGPTRSEKTVLVPLRSVRENRGGAGAAGSGRSGETHGADSRGSAIRRPGDVDVPAARHDVVTHQNQKGPEAAGNTGAETRGRVGVGVGGAGGIGVGRGVTPAQPVAQSQPVAPDMPPLLTRTGPDLIGATRRKWLADMDAKEKAEEAAKKERLRKDLDTIFRRKTTPLPTAEESIASIEKQLGPAPLPTAEESLASIEAKLGMRRTDAILASMDEVKIPSSDLHDMAREGRIKDALKDGRLNVVSARLKDDAGKTVIAVARENGHLAQIPFWIRQAVTELEMQEQIEANDPEAKPLPDHKPKQGGWGIGR